MKNNKLILIILALVVLVGGSYFLYNKLAPGVESNQLRPNENIAKNEASNQGANTENSSQNNGNNSENTQSSKAPDFTVVDADGKECKLSDLQGKPVVLNFWASWCGPCRMEMPDFDKKSKELEGKVYFMMVNLTGGQETLESAKAFIKEQGYTFPVYFDVNGEAGNLYGINSIPTTFFIDAEGNGIAYASGALDEATLQKGLDMIYSGE